jgi:hypothetical protein
MNDEEFRARLRKPLGHHYGRAYDLFKSFGTKFSDSIAEILSKSRSPGEVKRTLDLLEHIRDGLVVVMDTPRRPAQRIADLQKLDRYLSNLAGEVVATKGREGSTNLSHQGEAVAETRPLAETG